MIGSLLLILGALALLVVGGEALVRGASALALRLGVSPLAVGLTVVAFGTSAPEMVVSLNAVLSGAGDIAIGNVVGSNVANIALILGLAAAIRPVKIDWKVVRVDAPIMAAISLALMLMLVGGHLSRLEGGMLLTGLMVFVVVTWRQTGGDPESVPPALETVASPSGGMLLSGGLVLVGFGGLVVGGQWLVTGAVDLAGRAGLSEATIGLTIVAVGTSLPELVTSLIAAARGQGDIAVGNVIGSNIFNILGILGVTSLVAPISMGAITWIDLGVMGGLSLLVIPLLATGRSLERWEGMALVLVYLGYVYYLLAG